MFTKARLSLTLWYVVVIFALSASVSAVFYARTISVVSSEYQRIDERIQQQTGFFTPRQQVARYLLKADLDAVKRALMLQLVGINLVVVGVVGVCGYLLAGFTLEPIEAMYKQQQQFISDAAHELKTPLTAMRTSLEVGLLEPELTSPARLTLSENISEVDRVARLASHLLDLTQLQSGELTLTPVEVGAVVATALKQVKPLASKKRIKLIAPDLAEVWAKADEGRLIQVLVILLDNSIKYSQARSSVEVSVSQSRTKLNIKVIDTGIGMRPEELERATDRLYRGDKARHTEGFGLGLSIASSIVTKMRGQLHLSSTLGKGTTAAVILPKTSQPVLKSVG